MKKVLIVCLLVSILSWSVGLAVTPKVEVGTFTMTQTYFTPIGSDKKVGGGYSILTNAEGKDHVGLEFETGSKFILADNKYVDIDTGVRSVVTGATSFGIATGLTQWFPTENGIRGKDFKVHFYTFTPEPSIISELASGHLYDGKGDIGISHTVKVGDKTYTMGTEATLSSQGVQQNNEFDPNALSTKGFGQNTGYEIDNLVDEGGISYSGAVSSDSTTIVL